MTWLQFKNAVKVDLPVDNKRMNIATGNPNYLDSQILHAVVMIQKQIKFYQGNHETVYSQRDLVMEGMASLGTLPQYDQARPGDAYYKRTGRTCVSQPLWPYDWGNRYDLICGNPRITNCQFFISMDPYGKQFTVFPSVGLDDQIQLQWSGVKTQFDDNDTVPFEDDVIEAVAVFCKSRIALQVDHDMMEYTAYSREWKLLKAHLYADVRERSRLSMMDASPQNATRCANAVSTCRDAGSCYPLCAREDTVEFVMFGDSGELGPPTADVAALVKTLEPDFVLHLGDALYPNGDPSYIQDKFLKYYGMYLPNEMFWAPGNHDVETDNGDAFAALFGRQNVFSQGKRYWDFIPQNKVSGVQSLHVFVLDSEESSPLSEQFAWLQAELAVSAEFWNVVCFHRAPYTSDNAHYPGETKMRQPYGDWGAHAVICGHNHNYERIEVDGLPYINCGLGGATIRDFVNTPVPGSQFRYAAMNGALWVASRSDRMQIVFYNTNGDVIDSLAFEHAEVLQP